MFAFKPSRSPKLLLTCLLLSPVLLTSCQLDSRIGGSLRLSTRFPAFSVQAIPVGSTAISVAIYRPEQKNPEHSFVLTPAEPSRQLGLLEPGARRVVALAFDKNNQLLAGGKAQAMVLAGQTSQVSLELTAEYKPETAELQQLTSLLPAAQASTGANPVASPSPGVSSGGTVIIPVTGSSEQAAQGAAQALASAVPSLAPNLPTGPSGLLPSPIASTINTVQNAVNGTVDAVSNLPQAIASVLPSAVPSVINQVLPSAIPSAVTSVIPSIVPSVLPSAVPSALASAVNTLPEPVATFVPVIPGVTAPASPTPTPSAQPTAVPTAKPVCVLGICI